MGFHVHQRLWTIDFVLIVGVLQTEMVFAVGTTAGTKIANQATVAYKDANGNDLPPKTSSPVTTVVAQVAGVDISSNAGSNPAVPHGIVGFPVTITNTGNGADTIDLTTVSDSGFPTLIYANLDGDGVLDPEDIANGLLSNTGELAPDGTFDVIVVVTIPDGTSEDTVGNTTLTATSQTDGSVSDTGAYTINAIIAKLILGKSVDNPNPNPGDTLTYTIVYSNIGTAAAVNALVVTDSLPTNTTLCCGKFNVERYSKN